MHSSKPFIEGMLRAGASGYILKESIPEEMIKGIRTVLAGEVYLSASISGVVISEYKKFLSTIGPTLKSHQGRFSEPNSNAPRSPRISYPGHV